MATILEVAHEYRQKLAKLESVSTFLINHQYKKSYKSIEKSQNLLLQKIEEKKKSGVQPSVAWLKKEERYNELLNQIKYNIDQFSSKSAATITDTQSKMVDHAQEEAKAQVGHTWNRVPKEALENLVGFMGNGSPLKTIFSEYGTDSLEKSREVLFNAVTSGQNPRQTSRELKDSLDGNLSRALTIARTEQLRSYRTATVESYRANDDVVEGWTRIETLDLLICPICVEEHGREYETDDEFETHPNCRGTLIPRVKGVERHIETGAEWFDNQSEKTQRDILGNSKYEAYTAGEIDLKSLNERTYSDSWGGGRRERSLDEAKAEFQKQSEPVVEPQPEPVVEPSVPKEDLVYAPIVFEVANSEVVYSGYDTESQVSAWIDAIIKPPLDINLNSQYSLVSSKSIGLIVKEGLKGVSYTSTFKAVKSQGKGLFESYGSNQEVIPLPLLLKIKDKTLAEFKEFQPGINLVSSSPENLQLWAEGKWMDLLTPQKGLIGNSPSVVSSVPTKLVIKGGEQTFEQMEAAKPTTGKEVMSGTLTNKEDYKNFASDGNSTNGYRYLTTLSEGKTLTAAQAAAGKHYKGGNFVYIQREAAKLTLDPTATVDPMVKALDSIYEKKKNPLPENLIVYRGTRQEHFDPDSLVVGNDFYNKAFSSTSLSRGTAAGFSNNLMVEYRLPKGHPVFFIDGYAQKRSWPNSNEQEILIGRADKFVIESKEEVEQSGRKQTRIVVVPKE